MNKSVKKLITFSFLSSFSWMMYKIIFNLFLRNLGYTNDLISKITSYEMIGSAIFGIAIAIFGDKFGKKKTIFIASIGYSIITIFKTAFPNPLFLLTISFISGSLQTSRMMLLNSYIVDLTAPENRGKAFGLNFGLMMGSGLFGNLIGGFLGDYIGFAPTLYISAGIYFFSNIFLITVPESHKHEKLKIKTLFDFDHLAPIQRNTTKMFLLRSFFIAFGAGLFVNFGNVIFKDLFEMSSSMIGTALSFAQVGAGIGSILSYKVARKFGAYKFATILSFVVIPLIIMLGFARDPSLFTFLYAIRFSFMNMTNPVMSTVVYSNIPSDRVTTINSLRSSLNYLSRAFAAFLFGKIVALQSGYTILFLLSSIFYEIGFILLIKMLNPIKKAGKLKSLYGNNS